MKKFCLLFALLLPSCDLFTSIDYGPAIQTNKGQAFVYNELRAAFISVIMNSKTASQELKTKALADIEANRNDYLSFNSSLEQFLIAAGDIEPERILQLAKEAYDYVNTRKGKKDE